MKLKISKNGKKIDINVKKCSYIGKLFGLMFKSRNSSNLLFEFSREVKYSIHSYFVFFDFLAVWLDENNKILEWELVRPFTTVIRPKKSFKKLVELPLNKDNNEIIRFLVGREKFK